MDVSDPARLDAEELLAAYAARALTPLDALQAVLERIARRNPEINAFAVMNPAAREAAWASTQRWAAGRPQGRLDGVPVTVKDLIDIEGLPTRRGSNVTDPAPATADAPIVSALKRENAVLLGKTTTSEFGWKSPGDSPGSGITHNPWDKSHTPGGSSAGAAAASAACFGPIHIGTDAGGSVRIPAAWSGIVGFKPSFGRVPQWPLGAFGHVAVAGPMTRSVRDAALALSALAVFDPRDPFSLQMPAEDFCAGIEDGVAGMRIGVLTDHGFPAPLDADGEQALEEARKLLEAEGAILTPAQLDLPDTSKIFTRIWGAALARLVATVPEAKHALMDQGLIRAAARFRDVTASEMLEAEAMRVQAAHIMALAADRYDAFLSPCVPHCAPRADQDYPDAAHALWHHWAPWTFLFNLTRQPAASVPMGINEAGLPIAVQIATPLYRDAAALRVARALERALG